MLIGGLLRYRVTGRHQTAMGKQGTAANETDLKRGEYKERERKGQTNRVRQSETNVEKEEAKETMKEMRDSNRRKGDSLTGRYSLCEAISNQTSSLGHLPL